MTNQLSLPYEEIKSVAGRQYLRDNFTVSSKVAYKVPFEKLQERPGFNKRIVFENMDELAASIKAKGLQEPLVVDILEDGRVFIDKGHRRFKALQMIVDSGHPIQFVECFPNNRSITEMERMEDVYNSNMYQSKLKPIEQAAVCYDLKNNFGKISNELIAEKLGISRQKVDYLLLIAEAGDDIKNEILLGDMKLTEAVNFIRTKNKTDKQADKVEEQSHKTSAAPPPLPKDELSGELKELEELNRTTNPELKEYVSKPLDLVGNTVANKERKEDEGVKYDESREEIKQVQNIIKLADKMEAIVTKLDIPEGSKKDVSDIVKWMQKDLSELRTWVHKNKKR